MAAGQDLPLDGKVFFSSVIPADAYFSWEYGDGQYMHGLTATTIGTNVIITVSYA